MQFILTTKDHQVFLQKIYKSFGIGTCLAIPEEFYFDYDDETQLAYTDDVDNEL